MRKTKAVPAPLKARSLSELRDLQRQAAGQARAAQGAQTAPDHDHTSRDDTSSQAAAGKRRPHRFLPPGGPGAVRTQHPAPAAGHDRSSTEPALQVPQSTDAAILTSERSKDYSPERERLIAATQALNVGPETLAREDIALFRRVVQSVTPAAHSNRALLPPVPAAAPDQLHQRRQHAAGQVNDGALAVSDNFAPAAIDHDDTAFVQAGNDPHLIKALKKGKWQIQANLDLHGANIDDARERLDRFIQSCRDHQIRCVRIVHGKGYGSKDGGPVLKETVRRWLSQLAVVQAYTECNETDGGAGAVLVLLAKQKV